MEWRHLEKLQTNKINFPLNPRNQCKVHKQYLFFFYSHDMSQDADSNAQHVMSGTELMQSQQTPLQFPFSASWLG